MAPVPRRARRLGSRQWVYRMLGTQLEKREHASDDDDESDSDQGRGQSNDGKNRNKNRGSNRRDGGGGRGRDDATDDDGGKRNGNNKGNSQGKGKSNEDDTDTDNGDDNKNKEKNKNKENNNDNTPAFTPPPAEVTQVIQPPPPPPDTTTELVQAPPLVVTATADPETVTMVPTTVTMEPTTVVLVSTIMTTPTPDESTLSTFIPLESLSSQPPRKGLDEPLTGSPPDYYPLPTSGDNPTTTGTALANTSPSETNYGKDTDHENDDDGKHRHQDKPDEKDQTAEHILIGAGSIGIFILICLVCFFGWRFMKKRKEPNRRIGGRLTEKIYQKLPWLPRRDNRGWQSLEDEAARGVVTLPRSNTNLSAATTVQGSAVGYYGPNKQIMAADKTATDGAASTLGAGTVSGTAANAVAAGAGPGSHQPSQSLGSMGYTFASTDPNLTMRSRMPDPFFNQSELARQPSDAYDPSQRQVNRASELSSLSSGFGDGDIIVPQAILQQPAPAAPSLRQSNNLVNRFSWQSRTNTNRETVYTESSEDTPARFRSVNSWVNQQTGRVRRAQQRVENGEEIPPVPDLPGVQPGVPGVPLATGMPVEHQYTMMLDFEAPKRPEKQG